MLKWKNAALQLFFPQTHCAVCGNSLCDGLICEECLDKLSGLRRCSRCGSFLHATSLYCETCTFIKKPDFDRAVSAFPYEGIFQKSIRRMKFRGKTYYKRPFAEIMLELLAQEYADICFDLVLPVPVSPKRLQERGYNQVDLFGSIAAGILEIPYSTEALHTVGEIPSLIGKTRRQRFELTKKAFAAESLLVKDKTILLLDDVFTTGATAHACAGALKKAGAKAVYVATLAGHYTIN